jgi:hypothetical protein
VIQKQAYIWKMICVIQAPSKMKMVVWRIIQDCLPTGHQLVYRRILANDSCMFSGQIERVEHMFLIFPFARAVWERVKEQYRLRLCRKDLTNIKQWIVEFLGRESDVGASVLAVTCWHLWEAHNEARNNYVELQPQRVVNKI